MSLPHLLIFLACAPTPPARTRAPLTDEAYVWQRRWDAPVREAVAAADADRLVALGAELSWEPAGPRLTPVRWDRAALGDRPFGLALRVGPKSGDLALWTDTIVAAAVQLDAERPAELQLDFDAGRGQLAAYTAWVRAVNAAVAAPVVITALPDWLSSDDLPALLDAADGWVLQVHGFELPADPEHLRPLVTAAQASRDVDRAARLGRPLRVALPTHGWRLAFGEGGVFAGLLGEGSVDPGLPTRRLRASPSELAALVRSWRIDHPSALTGVLWYRLPTTADRLGWSPSTFAAVRAGRTPRGHARIAHDGPDLALVGAGDDDTPVVGVALSGTITGADALPGWHVEVTASGATFTPDEPLWLRPGERRPIGWARAASGTSATVLRGPDTPGSGAN